MDVSNVFSNMNENTVEYWIYKQIDASNKEQALEYLSSEYLAFLGDDLIEHIWQNDVFNLQPIVNEREYYLHGRVNYSDNVDDEFFVISLLQKLSIYDPDVLIRITDEDGEILLIETAEFLEKSFQNPDKTDGKVFLHKGDIHIITKELERRHDESYKPTDHWFKSLEIIKNNAQETRCNQNVQNCLQKRLSASRTDRFHTSHCYIPFNLARILSNKPETVSDLVHYFFYRIPDDIKRSKKLPQFKPEYYVLYPVKFTRILYAQLESQKLNEEILKKEYSIIPHSKNVTFKAFVRGYKLTIGFQILLNQLENNRTKECDVSSTKSFNTFVQNLKNNGYFFNELEGSKLFQEKFGKCKQYFMKNLSCSRDDQKRYIPKDIVLNDIFVENEQFHEELKSFQSKTLPPEDCDKWMNFDEKEFDQFLTEKFGNDQNISGDLKDICKNISLKLGNFMDRKDAEGILDSDDDQESDESYDVENEDDESDDEDAKLFSEQMKDFMKQMDFELSTSLSGENYKKSTILTDDNDDREKETQQLDEEYDNKEALEMCINLMQSYEGEPEISTGSGPTSTLFAAMKSRLPNLDEH